MTPIAIDEYRDAIREAVCGGCVCFSADRLRPVRCVHEESGECSLFAHLPEVVAAISNTESGSIEPYLTALRASVCSHCKHQDANGVCDLRDSRGPVPTWCMLDTYFNVVVGAVEDVRKLHAQG